MGKYKKKPVVIEAVQFLESTKNEAFDFVTCGRTGTFERSRPQMRIETLEGPMLASLGDWIIKGVQGEFYPCKPLIFEATYDKVDDDTPVGEVDKASTIKVEKTTNETI
jgi:hypothetical protein